jgi:8-oxo-dGTP diphosphatase
VAATSVADEPIPDRAGTVDPLMRVLLIRHAQAGDRRPGGRDLYRPLVETGRRRAEDLRALLADRPITAVLSSPATRCLQTVEPLARTLGLEIGEEPGLYEGSDAALALALLERDDDGELVVCSHGDVIPEVVELVAAAGAEVRGRGCEKGSIWLLERGGGRWTRATYFSRSRIDLPRPV